MNSNEPRSFLRAPFLGLLALLGGVLISACGSVATGRYAVPKAPKIARWSAFAHVRRPLDLTGPR